MNTYAKSGVNLNLYNKLIKKIKPIAAKTTTEEVMGEIGQFSALFDFTKLSKKYNNPVLVSSTDGVGTKLLIAQAMGKHNTIGIDLVAMCVNDLLAQGATPLFFLDYFATGKLNEDILLAVMDGITEGCKQAKVALVGGETAEMPDMYSDTHYDLAGFIVGVVDKNAILPNHSTIKTGDYIIGLQSSGIHSNGFSLVRHIFKNLDINYNNLSPWNNKLWGEILLEPTRIYVDLLLHIMPLLKGIAHITGGGLLDNISRILPDGFFADIDWHSWQWPEIFVWLCNEGKVRRSEMLQNFNCGIGIALIISPENLQDLEEYFKGQQEEIKIIGKINKL